VNGGPSDNTEYPRAGNAARMSGDCRDRLSTRRRSTNRQSGIHAVEGADSSRRRANISVKPSGLCARIKMVEAKSAGICESTICSALARGGDSDGHDATGWKRCANGLFCGDVVSLYTARNVPSGKRLGDRNLVDQLDGDRFKMAAAACAAGDKIDSTEREGLNVE